jgi:hypothetical protein
MRMNEDQTAQRRLMDEEAAFWRHVRFGELPPRVRPEELVELNEADTRLEVSLQPDDPRWVQ